MNNALISVSVFSVVFGISGIFVLLRSNTAVISARSASLLYAFHLGNWLESVFIILIIFRSELQLDHSENIYWFTHLGAGVSHFLVFLPYLLRAYRLYLIFVLETGFDDFCESPLYYRTTQRWLVQVLVLSTAGIFLVYAIFTVLFMTGVVENLLGVDSALISESPYVWILVFLRFLEQLSLILTCNAIKDVENDFNMVSELTLVTIFYTLTPFSALFWHVHQEYLWIFLVRNLLLLCISSIYPVFLSFTQSTSFQMLSIENLYSLELLLLHPEGLSAFENFLKTFKPLTIQEEGDEGSLLLNFLMLIECWLLSRDSKFLKEIEKFPMILETEADKMTLEDLLTTKDRLLDQLEKKYFRMFLNSEFMESLRRLVFRHEMLQLKISQTSLIRSGDKLKLGMWIDYL